MPQLTGLTDVHCHLLPYVDDGADNLDEALQLVAMQAQQGVSALYCTPHLRAGMFETPQEKVDRQFERLRQAAAALPSAPRLYLGRENHCDKTLLDNLRTGQARTLGGGNWLLIEYSSRHSRREVLRYLQAVLDAGYRPVIAHVERYPCITQDLSLARLLAEQGAWLQVNAAAVMGREGLRTRWFCHSLLKQDLVHLIASDAHHVDMRTPNLGECARFLSRRLPQEQFARIFYDNPACLAGLPADAAL